MEPAHFLTRVLLKNYKSVAAAAVDLSPLTFLTGPNGAGKSNFLDALRFVSDALGRSLDHALRVRGGIAEVRRRSGGHPTHFGVRCEFRLPSATGHYAFLVGSRSPGGYDVQTEECVVRGERTVRFLVRNGKIEDAPSDRVAHTLPEADCDRLYLPSMLEVPEFRTACECLSSIACYRMNPERIRGFQPPESGDLLREDGGNLTSVLRRIAETAPITRQRIEQYLGAIHVGLERVDVRAVGPIETLEFQTKGASGGDPWRFYAGNMAEGALRALGILLAVLPVGPRMVCLEHPEIGLHPHAVAVLLDAFREGAATKQILVTTHSPDLIGMVNDATERLVKVHTRNGASEFADSPPQGDLRLFGDSALWLPLFEETES